MRLRRTRGRPPEATLKSLVERTRTARSGSGSRSPSNVELDDPAAGRACPGTGRRASAVAGRRPQARPALRPADAPPHVPPRRRRRPSGELLLDETAIREQAGRILGRLRRVEVEAPGKSIDARPAARREPAGRRADSSLPSSASTSPALVASGIAGRLRELRTNRVEPGDTIGQVGLATLRRHFGMLLAKEPGTRLGDDIEELHDMRVASRRLRAALALFDDFLPGRGGEAPAGARLARADDRRGPRSRRPARAARRVGRRRADRGSRAAHPPARAARGGAVACARGDAAGTRLAALRTIRSQVRIHAAIPDRRADTCRARGGAGSRRAPAPCGAKGDEADR